MSLLSQALVASGRVSTALSQNESSTYLSRSPDGFVRSHTTLRICTCLVAVGVADLDLPLAKLAQLMVREDYSEFCWLEEHVLESADQEGAKVTVGRNKYDDKLLVLHDCGTVDESVFADKLVARLEKVFREQLACACGVEVDDDDMLQRTSTSPVTGARPAKSTAAASGPSPAEDKYLLQYSQVLMLPMRWFKTAISLLFSH